MKKPSATIYSPAMELPVITKRIIRRNKRRRFEQEAEPAESLNNMVPPPSEALIAELNRLGQEYPFCICFKAKVYDTL
jgi:hypothetical protein